MKIIQKTKTKQKTLAGKVFKVCCVPLVLFYFLTVHMGHFARGLQTKERRTKAENQNYDSQDLTNPYRQKKKSFS